MALINNVAFSNEQAQRLKNFRKIVENARNLRPEDEVPPVLKPFVEDIDPRLPDMPDELETWV